MNVSSNRRVIGIVGNGEDKFTPLGAARARNAILTIINSNPDAVIRSGHSRMRGVDIWVEEVAEKLGRKADLDIQAPEVEQWPDEALKIGYRSRNLAIAKSDFVYVIVADSYPPNYSGKRFLDKTGEPYCYHCKGERPLHVKSGACWTGLHATDSKWVVIPNQ